MTLKPAHRFLLYTGCFCGLLVGGYFGSPWISQACCGVENLPELRSQLTVNSERGEELECRQAKLLQVMASREHVMSLLTAGKISLMAAAASFRDLDMQSPNFKWETFRDAYPATTDEERFCRQVIAHIPQDVDNPNAPGNILAERFKAELQQSLSHGGSIHLPTKATEL